MQFWIFQVAIVGSTITMSGLSASARETEGSQLTITTPRHGVIVGSTVELSYDLEKGTKDDHLHAFVGGQYQKEFEGTLHRLTSGKHQITVRVDDHDLLEPSDSIQNEVK